MRRKLAIIAMLSVLIAFSAWAQIPAKPDIRASVTPLQATVGDPLTYTIKIDWPAGLEVYPPEPEAELGDFSVLGRKVGNLEKTANGFHLETILTLAAYKTGILGIPGVEVHYTDADGNKQVEKGPEIAVEIVSVLPQQTAPAAPQTQPQTAPQGQVVSPDQLPTSPQGVPESQDIRPIKGPFSIPTDLLTLLLLSLPVLIVAAGLFFLLRRIRRRNKERDLAKQFEKPEPYALAIERLSNPALAEALQADDAVAFYTELSDILREYLEGRFDLFALELTTTEIVRELKTITIDGFQKAALGGILERSDLAKFAGLPPTLDQRTGDLGKARDFVEATKPLPETPEPDAKPPQQEVSA